jgi:hypothetical protein
MFSAMPSDSIGGIGLQHQDRAEEGGEGRVSFGQCIDHALFVGDQLVNSALRGCKTSVCQKFTSRIKSGPPVSCRNDRTTQRSAHYCRGVSRHRRERVRWRVAQTGSWLVSRIGSRSICDGVTSDLGFNHRRRELEGARYKFASASVHRYSICFHCGCIKKDPEILIM